LRRSVHNETLGEGKSWGEVKHLARNIGSDGDVLLTPYVPKGITGYDDDDDDIFIVAPCILDSLNSLHTNECTVIW